MYLYTQCFSLLFLIEDELEPGKKVAMKEEPLRIGTGIEAAKARELEVDVEPRAIEQPEPAGGELPDFEIPLRPDSPDPSYRPNDAEVRRLMANPRNFNLRSRPLGPFQQ